MERYFKRTYDSLDRIFEFVDDFLGSENLGESNSFALNLVLEELFTNMVKYSPESEEDIRIAIERDDDRLVVSLTDFDVEPFDITQAPEVDTGKPLSERQPGGLGIHFVRKMTDTLSYEYEDRRSKITLTRRLEA